MMRALGRQFFRFALVGLATNLLAYLAYLLLTRDWLTPKIGMTVTYLFAVAAAFALNRSWTFSFRGAANPALARHAVAYAAGYAVNWLALAMFVDHMRLPHEIIQGCMILLLAIVLFVVQRYWVFSPET